MTAGRQKSIQPERRDGRCFGYTQKPGEYDGGQAEDVRVPYANTGPLKVPDSLSDEQAIFLYDIFPTGYFEADIANVRLGDDVAVFGAGPVGYFAVLSSFLRGAARVFSIDHEPARLEKTQAWGAETINFEKNDPVQTIKRGEARSRRRGIWAVGHYKAPEIKDPVYEKQNPLQVINWIVQAARKFSTFGIPGVCMGAYNQFPLNQFFNRELQMRLCQCPVKNYNEQLLHLIEMPGSTLRRSSAM
ncbi:MAG: hypothetical protein A2010_05850 [Nitrospirae bacterium GWD2_57_9]|nr:MAG: hypothetical protein A2010_05850 [Nitrospirae bacterium GWD2_57_9]OGW47420.1 MAG: hypothetical protein A2078_14690 [Nitrospirae bacterium GWC2_57_9]